MAWLGSDIIAGFVLGHVLKPTGKNAVQEHRVSRRTVAYISVFGAPALGGFVVVGQTVKEYGSCIALP